MKTSFMAYEAGIRYGCRLVYPKLWDGLLCITVPNMHELVPEDEEGMDIKVVYN